MSRSPSSGAAAFGPRALTVSVGKTVRNNKLTSHSLAWPDLASALTTFKVTDETHSDYMNGSKADQDRIKDVGYLVGGRFDGDVRKRTGLIDRSIVTLDIDHLGPGYEQALADAYKGMAYVAHTTHKHSSGAPRLRIVFPLARDVLPEEYEPVSRRLALLLGLNYYDDTTFQPSRAMHAPSRSVDGDEWSVVAEGDLADPDFLLDLYDDWRDVSQWPVSERETTLRQPGTKQADPEDKPGWVGAFCRAYNVLDAMAEFVPDAYSVCETQGHDRFSYNLSTTTGGAIVYGDGRWLYSHHETDPCSRRLVNAFDLVRLHRFGDLDEKSKPETPASALPSYQAMVDLCKELPDVRFVVLGSVLDTRRDYAEELHRYAQEKGFSVGTNLIFKDPEASVHFWAQSLDYFWMTSLPRSEGIPTAVEEAMALGIPVVSFDVGSVSEIVKHGKTGYVAPVYGVSTVARHTIHLINHPYLRARMGEESKRLAHRHFSAEQCAKSHFKCYRQVISRLER